MKRKHDYHKMELCTAVALALFWLLSVGQDAQARNLYVSPSGDGSDGSTWTKAWKSFTSIDWTQVVTGDQIVVDGGATGASQSYTGAFTIPVSGIIIRQAKDAQHGGQVIITGTGLQPAQTGVTISGTNVQFVGARRSGIKITTFAGECVRIQGHYNALKNVEVGSVTGFPPYGGGRVGALVFGGYGNNFVNCDFRDTSRCAVEKPIAGVGNSANFKNCTFGNNWYGWWGEWGVGIYGARPDGTTVASTIHATHCVFGPMLNKGIDVVQGRNAVVDSLFLGSNAANVSFEPAVGSTAVIRLNNCTLYEPNYSGPAQYNTTFANLSTNGNGTMRVGNCIVYGGKVRVPVTQVISTGGNVQYHVTENTTALAPDIVNPLYVEETQLWHAVNAQTISPQSWTTQGYALSSGSPAIGKGSTITSVTSIVPAYGPAGHFPPLGGP